MISTINNLIAIPKTGETKKPAAKSADLGAFEALLAVLMGQRLDSPGNNLASYVDALSGEVDDSGGGMNMHDIISILSQVNSSMKNIQGMPLIWQSLVEKLAGADSNKINQLEGLEQLMTNSKAQPDENADVYKMLKELNPEGIQFADKQDNPQHQTMDINKAVIETLMKAVSVQYEGARNKQVNNSGGETAKSTGNLDESSKFPSITKMPVISKGQEIQSIGLPDKVNIVNTPSQSIEVNAKQSEQAFDEDPNQLILQKPEILKLIKSLEVAKPIIGEAIDRTEQEKTVQDTKSYSADSIDKKLDIPVKMAHSAGGEKEPSSNDKSPFHVVMDSIKPGESKIQSGQLNFESAAQQGKDAIMDQIYNKMKAISITGTSELHVSLKPDELGQVSIKLVIDKGIMVGKIMVENEQVKNLIESNLPQMKENLKHQNLNVSELSVSVGTGQQSPTGHQYQGYGERRYVPDKMFTTAHSSILTMRDELTSGGRVKDNRLVNLLA